MDVIEELKFWENSQKNLGGGGSGGGWGGVGWGGSGWWGGGVRVDVNEELKFLWKIKKKNIFFWGGGGGFGSLGGGGGGVRVDMNREVKFL